MQLLCRITKFAWFDEGVAVRAIVKETSKFLQATIAHCTIGLRILNELVTEMNYKSKNRSLTQQRKVAVSFRDVALLDVFEVALSMVNQIATRAIALDSLPPQEAPRVHDMLLEQALTLLLGCLSFDFIGTNPDESADEVPTLQIVRAGGSTPCAPPLCALFLFAVRLRPLCARSYILRAPPPVEEAGLPRGAVAAAARAAKE